MYLISNPKWAGSNKPIPLWLFHASIAGIPKTVARAQVNSIIPEIYWEHRSPFT